MNQGNIRLQSYGIDIAQMPNDKQIKMLRSFFNKLEGDVTVDFSSYQGANIGSVEYSEGTASSRILNDITSFYETGVVPEGTAGGINDFIRYSLYVDANGVIIPTVEKQFNSNSMAKRSEEIFDAVKNELLKLNNDSVVIRDNNKRVYFDNIFVEEFTSSADTQNTFRETKAIKMNAAYDAKNIVEYSKYIKPLANNGTHDNEYADATNGFEYYKAEFAIKENDGTYTLCGATLVVRIDKNNKPYVYDFVSPKIKKKGLILTPSKTVSGMGLTSNTMNSRSPSEPNITQSDKEVNSVMNEGTDTRESLSIDSLGRELSEGQREYFKNSMVVDENGRLKVMYHGSRTPGFTVFNPDQADDGISLFFTDNLDNAASYSATREIYSPDKHYSFDELNEMVQGTTNGDWEVSKDGNEYVILEAGEYEETRGTLDDIRDYFINNYLPYIYEQNGANYEVYINLTNPLVVDANNNNWDELSGIWNGKISHQYEYALLYNQLGDDLWEIEYSDFGDYKTESFTREQLEKKFGEDEALKLINGDEISMVVFDEKGNKVPNTTREYAQYAKDKGYDGVIFNNIIDYDVKMEVNENPSQVVIAFNSNQVKSIYNENPTDNEDIRYSISLRDKDNFKRFSNEINNYLDNPNPKQENLLVMDYTPKLLQRIGLDNKKILMTIGHFKTITSAKQNKRDHNHNLKIMEVKKAPLILEHPAMILNSINPKSYNSVVVVSDILDYKGDPIIIALSSNYNGLYINQISANKLASMYGRKNFKDFLENVYLMNGIMYVDKKRSQNLHDRLRVQFPAVVTSKVSFNKILHTIDEYVNGISVKIGEVLNDKVAFSLNIDEEFEEIFGGESSSNILDEGLKALKDVEVNSEAIKKIANGLIREYGSTYDKDTFAGNLEKIFAYIKNTNHLNYQDMLEIISDVAMPVIREATEKDSESVRAYNQFMPN